MTVNEVNGLHSPPPSADAVANATAEELAANQEHEEVSCRSSCFFEWCLRPHHQIEGVEDKFVCDLCREEIKGGELEFKLHQIGLHVNPYYLSASDRILAQISSYAVQTDKTESPWVPDWDTFKVRNPLIFVHSSIV